MFSVLKHADPLLASLGCRNPTSARFHACERRWKCDEVWADGRGCYEFAPEHLAVLEGPKKLRRPGVRGREAEDREVVYVNPSAMTRKRWETYKSAMEEMARSVDATAGGGKKRSADESLPNYIVTLSAGSWWKSLMKFDSCRLFRWPDIHLCPSCRRSYRSSNLARCTRSRSRKIRACRVATTSPFPNFSPLTSPPAVRPNSTRKRERTRRRSSLAGRTRGRSCPGTPRRSTWAKRTSVFSSSRSRGHSCRILRAGRTLRGLSRSGRGTSCPRHHFRRLSRNQSARECTTPQLSRPRLSAPGSRSSLAPNLGPPQPQPTASLKPEPESHLPLARSSSPRPLPPHQTSSSRLCT